MATYTAFFGSLRPGPPGSYDNITYYYPVYADVIVFDPTGKPLPWGSGGPWNCFLALASIDGMAAGDTLATLRTKVMANLRPQYPEILPADTVKAVWLDNGGLLSL